MVNGFLVLSGIRPDAGCPHVDGDLVAPLCPGERLRWYEGDVVRDVSPAEAASLLDAARALTWADSTARAFLNVLNDEED